ncbi:hypothetical protein PIROE2DRAFT_62570 [Piromyces sp. E2]|nr:hypothetical protein PIROE2DRAFT_62570 [Piromyces sp. E2]|eukprot:OUM61341.1 hypothetical protein PIROE2DRAFT_62570 [Piromyces sp. E2]
MDYLKIYEALPLLENYKDNVVEWISDFARLMRICNIDNNKQINNWAYEAVGSVSKREQKLLVERIGNGRTEEHYPSLKEIQKAVKKSLGITDGDKLAYLQGLKIKEGETIKGFNDRYRKLYHDLPRELQNEVTIRNYRNSISTRSFPYSQVFTSKCESLTDAYTAVETAEEAEKEWNKHNNNIINMSEPGYMETLIIILISFTGGTNNNYNHSNNNDFNYKNYNRNYNNTFLPFYNNNSNNFMTDNRYNNYNDNGNTYNYNYNSHNHNYQPRNNGPQNFGRGTNYSRENNMVNKINNSKFGINGDNNYSNDEDNNRINKSNIATITCHRCFQPGPKSIDC